MPLKSDIRSRHVPSRCGEPRGPMINRPSVEYTGHGNDLIYDGWGGRMFRASEKWVRQGCDNLIQKYTEDGGDWCNYNDLYHFWNIEDTDAGARDGWSPSKDWRVELVFIYTWLDGGPLFDKFGERVLVVEPDPRCFPYESYQEV